MARRAGVPVEDVAKARKLLKAVAITIASGDAAAWRRLAVAYDVIDVGGAFVDDEPDLEQPVDSTLPVAQPAPAPPRSEPDPGTSIDETVAIDEELRLELDEPPQHRSAASAPAGSTLLEGRAPAQARGGTVQMPIHMPAQVTPASAAASAQPASSGYDSGTTPMQSVPSSVLDVEKYAVLCAWTEAHPERREHLHQQYGLSGEAERRALDQRFQALFAKNRDMRSAFDKRLRLHLGFLRR